MGAATAEEELKAAIILSFARFTTWPAKETDASKPLVFCVVHNTGVLEALKRHVTRHLTRHATATLVNGRPVSIVEVRTAADAASCDLVYIGSASAKMADEVIRALAGSGALTVGESSRFLDTGGMVNIFEEDGRLRFEVDMKTLSGRGFTISSKLLKLGYIRNQGASR